MNNEHLIAFEKKSPYCGNIIKKLSEFNNYVSNSKNKKIGLVLCHGHKHGYAVLKNYKIVDYWYFIDIDPETNPDYICDVCDPNALEYFPDNFFDCIMSAYCPIGDMRNRYFSVMTSLKRTLKRNGVIVSLELPKLFYWFFNKNQLNQISKYLFKCADSDAFFKFKKEYDHNINNNCPKFIGNFYILRDFYREHEPSKITKIELDNIKMILKINKFSFVGVHDKHMLFKPMTNN